MKNFEKFNIQQNKNKQKLDSIAIQLKQTSQLVADINIKITTTSLSISHKITEGIPDLV